MHYQPFTFKSGFAPSLSWDGSPKGLGGFQIHWPFLFSYPVLISATSDTLDHLLSAEILFLEVLDSFILTFHLTSQAFPSLLLIKWCLGSFMTLIYLTLLCSLLESLSQLFHLLENDFKSYAFNADLSPVSAPEFPVVCNTPPTLQNNLNFKIKAQGIIPSLKLAHLS